MLFKILSERKLWPTNGGVTDKGANRPLAS